MTRSVSAFLDILRVLAAAVVLCNHCLQYWADPAWPPMMAMYEIAHAAVIVFFVLSGYMIAYSTAAKRSTPRSYAIARLSRLSSVTLPALALTALLQLAGSHINPAFYHTISRGHELPRYLLAATYLQSIWFSAASPPTNGPLWSLSYEFWYYVIFGIAMLLPAGGRRNLLCGAALAIAGPNILLLFPCWLAGVASCHSAQKSALPRHLAACGLFLSLLLLLLVGLFVPALPYPLGHERLWFSSEFVKDWLLSACVAAAIRFFVTCHLADPPEAIRHAARWTADRTFSLYLYHYPMILFVTAVWGVSAAHPIMCLFAIVAILFFVILLSAATEQKRAFWRALLENYLPGRTR